MVLVKIYKPMGCAEMKQTLASPIKGRCEQGAKDYRGGEIEQDFDDDFQTIFRGECYAYGSNLNFEI